MAEQERTVELRYWQHGLIFLLACALVVTRRPDAVYHPQFWGEDGHVWFADAFNYGWWQALFRTQDGYFQTLPRLAASLALLVPLALAPLIPNLIAIMVEALPVNLLLSARSAAWGSFRQRSLLACVYVALPNCREMDGVITNSQWVFALSGFLVLALSPPRSRAERVLDLSALLLCGLTGPFCAFLVPVAALLAWKRRETWRWIETAILSGCSLIQAWGLLVINPAGRSHYAPVGATFDLFMRLLGGQVYLAALLGGNSADRLPGAGVTIFLGCVAILGTAVVAICLATARLEMQLFIGFSFLLLAVSLVSPNTGAPNGTTAWYMLAGGTGIRYWFFPTVAFAWSILFVFRSRRQILQVLGGYLLFFLCIGVVRDWRHPAFQDLHFSDYAARVSAAPAGSVIVIPENPAAGWTIRLEKHATAR